MCILETCNQGGVGVNFYDLVSQRESIRSYDPDRKIPEDVLGRILDAGRFAPSAKNGQPWQFLLVSSPGMLREVRSCYSAQWFQDAPYVLAVKGNRDKAWTRSSDGYNTLETDLAIAMDHIILAAEYEGLGTCWVAAFSPAVLEKVLGLTKNEKVFALTPLGYPPAGFIKKHRKTRKSFGEVVSFI